MNDLYVKSPGMQTSIQDQGRFGYQWSGMCPSGAMDMRALRIANLLVDNDMDEAGLEVTIMGPELVFQTDEVIAVTGADLSPTIDGQPLPMYQAYAVKSGQSLRFGTRKYGCRAYIAFAGGLDVEPLYGSRSTWLRINIGPVNHALKAGESYGFRAPKGTLPNLGARRCEKEIIKGDDVLLRIILGPQDYLFTEGGLENLLNPDGFKVSDLANRQGYRLEGPKVELKKKGSIVSDGIAKGAIQIPPNEQPLVLLSERQSTGGYAKIGNVITVDLPKIGQAMPGSRIHFTTVSVEEAQDLVAEEAAFFAALKEKLTASGPHTYRATVNNHAYVITIEEIE
ncbi:MAG: biotin-dependent carboxyltransferase family protein [Firmicutes bacterium]|nr:biotin-dependent carboxyltransferase family protein [Bacillota bacterium]